MGFMDYLSDLYESLTVQSAEAEEPQKDDSGLSLPSKSAEEAFGLPNSLWQFGITGLCEDLC